MFMNINTRFIKKYNKNKYNKTNKFFLKKLQVLRFGAAVPAVFVGSEKNLAGCHERHRHPYQTLHLTADMVAWLLGQGL